MANTYYVDSSRGSDNNNGLSPDSAFKSIEQVNKLALQPGDQVLFQRGQTFTEKLSPKTAGTAEQPITFGAYGEGADPVFKGDTITIDSDHVVLEGLDVTGAPVGIMIEDAAGVRLVDVDARDNGMHGVEVSNSEDVSVAGGTFTNNGKKNGGDGVGHGIIVSNESHDVTIDGVDTFSNAEAGIQFANDALDNNVVRNSKIHGNNEDGIAIKGGNHMFVGNEFYDNGKNAINLYQNSDYLYLFGNDVKARPDVYSNALDVRDGAYVISANNRYEGGTNAAVEVNVTAGDGSKFTDDLFVGGGTKGPRATVNVDGGSGHVFENARFVQDNDDANAMTVRFGGEDVTVNNSEFFAKSGLALDYREGKEFLGSGNTFHGEGGEDRLAQIGAEVFEKLDVGGLGKEAVTKALDMDDLLSFETSDEVVSQPPAGQTSRAPEDEIIVGKSGDDTIHGEDGDDGIAGGYGHDKVYGDAGNDYLQGAGGNDELHGGVGDDELMGNGGKDTLLGGEGKDRLHGEHGADRLDGGAGADVMSGGGNGDLFVFQKGEADGDTVLDFGTGQDEIRFEGYGSGAAFEQVEGSTWQVTDGGTVETVDVIGTLEQGDFMFA